MARTLFLAFVTIATGSAGRGRPVEAACALPQNAHQNATQSLALAQPAQIHRDWQKSPAIVQLDTKQDLYVIGDPHADYDRLVAVLAGAGLIAGKPSDPAKVSWVGGKAVLVFTGDYIDKGDAALQVIALVRALESAAAGAGGRVIPLMGNHEAEFLANPKEQKVMEFAAQLTAAKMSPDAVAACQGDLGEFLCSLAFGVRVNDWFLSHAGNTGGRSMQTLVNDLQSGVDHDGFVSQQLIGDASILEARLGDAPWFDVNGSDEATTLRKYASALGVAHIVEGHQPGHVQFADGVRRKSGEMFQRYGLIFLEDTGMSKGVADSVGAALHIDMQQPEHVTAICPDGTVTVLWDSTKAQVLGRAKPCGP